ncbi:MAG: DUF4159 domain-containing protein [Acidobacteria bacterium]|nr:DUF4159 domain-containing protein [Acidobacteriota bacterium]
MRFRAAVIVSVVLAATLAFAQGRRFGGFDALRTPTLPEANTPYDGRFTFVRVTYETAPGGYWYRGQPAWMHGHPTAERNLMRIMDALTTLMPHVDEINTLSLEDPEIFKYPVLYMIEVSWWQMTEKEAVSLRTYLQKGGFVIIDDFKMPGGIGGPGWDHFAANMKQVLPDAEFVDLDVSHPIFHQFFDIPSFDIIQQAYNQGRPSFIGLHRDNDPAKPLQMMIHYNTDISQYWEWSERGFRSIEETNEAYKLGVNAILYGLTH